MKKLLILALLLAACGPTDPAPAEKGNALDNQVQARYVPVLVQLAKLAEMVGADMQAGAVIREQYVGLWPPEAPEGFAIVIWLDRLDGSTKQYVNYSAFRLDRPAPGNP